MALTRQQIYDRIKSSSKDSYILEEMKRIGFWENSEIPSVPEQLIAEETALQKTLNQLLAQDKKYSDQEAMLRAMRKQRMQESKQKRDINKQKRAQKIIEKSEKWQQVNQKQMIYLGESVSKGLQNEQQNPILLSKFNLDFFENIYDFSMQSGFDLPTLKYLAYNRKVSKSTHYHVFEIPKKSGGTRKITAPKTKLKAFQLWILEHILNKIVVAPMVHGFVQNRSIVSNANQHVQKNVVLNLDLKDFFPSISYKRVKGLFRIFGYSESMATLLALACTTCDIEKIQIDGETYYVQKGSRYLPQGSPASPAISNLIAYKLDKRLHGLASKYGFTYTRYADDLTFSGNEEAAQYMGKFLCFVKKTIKSEDFEVNNDKTSIMRPSNQQKVTGIVVNKKLNIDRKRLRQFRALLHNIDQNGWQNQTWGKAIHLINAVEGYIQFVKMVDAAKGAKFHQTLLNIIAKHGRPIIESKIMQVSKAATPEAPIVEKTISKATTDKQTDWWNLF